MEKPTITSARDVIVDKAEIFLLTRNVEDLKATATSFRHWIVGAKFQDGQFIFLEANNDKGRLMPIVSDEVFEVVDTVKYLGTVRTSPYRLKTYAYENKHNMKPYTFLVTNCQIWVKELCANLGLKLSEGTFAEYYAKAGIVASFLFGLTGAAVTIGSMLIANAMSSAGSYNSSQKSGSFTGSKAIKDSSSKKQK